MLSFLETYTNHSLCMYVYVCMYISLHVMSLETYASHGLYICVCVCVCVSVIMIHVSLNASIEKLYDIYIYTHTFNIHTCMYRWPAWCRSIDTETVYGYTHTHTHTHTHNTHTYRWPARCRSIDTETVCIIYMYTHTHTHTHNTHVPVAGSVQEHRY